MNIRWGFFRLWILISVPWIGAIGALIWSDGLVGKLSVKRRGVSMPIGAGTL